MNDKLESNETKVSSVKAEEKIIQAEHSTLANEVVREPKPAVYLSHDKVMKKIRNWAQDDGSTPSILVSVHDGSFHLGYYSGMGSSDCTPIDNLDPQYKEVITRLFQSGDLVESGKAFTLFPGSDFFKKLIFVNLDINK
jgi:hypothetical protein